MLWLPSPALLLSPLDQAACPIGDDVGLTWSGSQQRSSSVYRSAATGIGRPLRGLGLVTDKANRALHPEGGDVVWRGPLRPRAVPSLFPWAPGPEFESTPSFQNSDCVSEKAEGRGFVRWHVLTYGHQLRRKRLGERDGLL